MEDQLDMAPVPSEPLVQVDQKMLYHETQLQHYRAEHNALVPIARLLPELLSEIFRTVVAAPGEKSTKAWTVAEQNEFWSFDPDMAYHSAPMAIVLTHVCRLWRHIARTDPLLWGEVWVTRYYWAWRMLERSRMSPLTLRVHIPSGPVTRALHAVSSAHARTIDICIAALKHLDRIQHLCLSLPRDDSSTEPLLLLDHPAPILHTLCIFSPLQSRRVEIRRLTQDVFCGGMPPLTRLMLGGIEMPITLSLLQTPSIQHLCLTVIPSWKNESLNKFLDILSELRSLKTLILRTCIPRTNDVIAGNRLPLRLRKLEWLELQDDLDSIIGLMSHLRDVSTTTRVRFLPHHSSHTDAVNPQQDTWSSLNDMLRIVAPFAVGSRTFRLRALKQIEGVYLNVSLWPDIVSGADIAEAKSAKVAFNVDFEGQGVQLHDFVHMTVDALSMHELEVLSYCAHDETGYHLADWPPVLAPLNSLHTLWVSTQTLAIILNVHAQVAGSDLEHNSLPRTVRTLGLDSVILTHALMNKLRAFLQVRRFERVQIINSTIRKVYLDELHKLANIEIIKSARGSPLFDPMMGLGPGLASLSAEDAEDDFIEQHIADSQPTSLRDVRSPFASDDADAI